MPRPYRLGKRAIGVAATRQRIMDATRELLETGGIEQANIQAIAKEAGVTRPTVYQQFGTHSELLLAVINDALDRADVLAFTPQLDALLLVVEEGKTTEPEFLQIMEILKGSVPILGTVLNKIGRDHLSLSTMKRTNAGNVKERG